MVEFNEVELLYTINGSNIHLFHLTLVAEGNHDKTRQLVILWLQNVFITLIVGGCRQY